MGKSDLILFLALALALSTCSIIPSSREATALCHVPAHHVLSDPSVGFRLRVGWPQDAITTPQKSGAVTRQNLQRIVLQTSSSACLDDWGSNLTSLVIG